VGWWCYFQVRQVGFQTEKYAVAYFLVWKLGRSKHTAAKEAGGERKSHEVRDGLRI
jgi:hypothetical protein